MLIQEIPYRFCCAGTWWNDVLCSSTSTSPILNEQNIFSLSFFASYSTAPYSMVHRLSSVLPYTNVPWSSILRQSHTSNESLSLMVQDNSSYTKHWKRSYLCPYISLHSHPWHTSVHRQKVPWSPLFLRHLVYVLDICRSSWIHQWIPRHNQRLIDPTEFSMVLFYRKTLKVRENAKKKHSYSV